MRSGNSGSIQRPRRRYCSHADRERVEDQEQRDEDRDDEPGTPLPSVVDTMSWAVIAIHGTAPMTHP
jgi:hypothetical protein